MITVELEPEELHTLIRVLRNILSDGPRLGVETSKLKMLLQRIEYLEMRAMLDHEVGRK